MKLDDAGLAEVRLELEHLCLERLLNGGLSPEAAVRYHRLCRLEDAYLDDAEAGAGDQR